MQLSVLVPVYREPRLVGDILSKLAKNTYGEKEIYVIVDGKTNREIENALDGYRKQIHIIYNDAQLGKAKSLNKLALSLDTGILVFLDNDISLPDDEKFLENVASEFVKHDVVEFPKEAVTHSILSGMLGFEFLSYAIAGYSFARIAHRSPSMNGAAFAITKEWFAGLNGFHPVINEDMDLASRAFLKHARFSYNPRLKVYNALPASLKEWFSQRKRWAINNVLWLKKNFLHLVRYFFKDAGVRKSLGMVFLPFLIYIVLYLVLHSLGLTSLLPFILIIGIHFHILIGFLLGLAHFHLIINGFIPVMLGLLSTAVVTFIFSRILTFKFNPVSFLCYYFFYIPVWLLANLVYGVIVLFNMKIKLDWKVSD